MLGDDDDGEEDAVRYDKIFRLDWLNPLAVGQLQVLYSIQVKFAAIRLDQRRIEYFPDQFKDLTVPFQLTIHSSSADKLITDYAGRFPCL